MTEVALYEERARVVEMHLEGISDSQIAKTLNITRNQLKAHLDEFRAVARSDEQLRDRGRDVVHEYDTQQSRIIKEMWDVVRTAESESDLKVRASTLKMLSDVQARRVEVLQKAGLIAENSITDELVRTQENVDTLVAILKDIKNEFPEVATIIAQRLQQVTGEVEPLPPEV